MKTLVGLIIFMVAMASCMSYSCPTYSTSKGHNSAVASAKKGKPAKKGATPYYKTLHVAERD